MAGGCALRLRDVSKLTRQLLPTAETSNKTGNRTERNGTGNPTEPMGQNDGKQPHGEQMRTIFSCMWPSCERNCDSLEEIERHVRSHLG